jgi:hypothetical protein
MQWLKANASAGVMISVGKELIHQGRQEFITLHVEGQSGIIAYCRLSIQFNSSFKLTRIHLHLTHYVIGP